MTSAEQYRPNTLSNQSAQVQMARIKSVAQIKHTPRYKALRDMFSLKRHLNSSECGDGKLSHYVLIRISSTVKDTRDKVQVWIPTIKPLSRLSVKETSDRPISTNARVKARRQTPRAKKRKVTLRVIASCITSSLSENLKETSSGEFDRHQGSADSSTSLWLS